MMNICYIQDLTEYLLKYGVNTGSYEADKLLKNINGLVQNVGNGVPKPPTQKWLCRLRLCKPPLWSTGVDCFKPLLVELGRWVKKGWGILFKCMTARCTQIELLNSLTFDSFLMSLRRFIARRGRPNKILSDCRTNFQGDRAESCIFSHESTPGRPAL